MYQVRLVVDGKSFNQPLKVVMDPRSVATEAELQRQYEVGRQYFLEAIRAREGEAEIHSMQARLGAVAAKLPAEHAELATQIAQLQEAIKKILAGRRGSEDEDMGLDSASDGIAGALRVVESGDRTIPSQAVELFEESARALKSRIGEWERMKTSLLPQLNDKLKRAGLEPVSIGK
jgi:hypothetical protein